MAINYNVNPYYDDYDETKQFYRILFRPGRAVQARELTQLQTSLQKQIDRFGQSIYKEGSIVVPGGQLVDRKYPYVKLTASYGSNVSDTLISSLIGHTISGANSGVKAIVVNSVVSTSAGDPSTIYVRYTSSNVFSTGSNTVFQAGEVITNVSGNITLQVANTAPTGNGTAFSVTNGVVFTKGVFAYFDDQTFVVEKYTQANNVILGFEVTESTVESTADTSLLDPAVGASNYVAPGADRYKIALDLGKRPLTPSAVDDPNFVELIRIEDGEVISQNLGPQYSVLGDTLARRTFDESGNYTVRPYSIDLVNHLKSGSNTNDGIFLASDGGDDNKYVGIIQPGKAYVKGYEVENVRSKRIIGNKARDFANVNNGIISTTIGNFIYVTNVNSIPDLSTLSSISLRDRYTVTRSSAAGSEVGTAKIRGFEFYSGTPGDAAAIYKIWLFDVVMNAGYVFENDVKQIYADNSGYVDFTADISPTLITLTGSVTTSNITGNGSNVVTGIASRFDAEVSVDDFITIDNVKYRVTAIANSSSLFVTPNVVSNLSGTLAYVDTINYNDTQYLAHVFELPYSTIRSVDPTNLETTYDTKRSYSRSLSSNTVTITAGTDEVFAGISTTNYTLFVTNGAYAGNVLNPTPYITRGGSPTGKNITIDLSPLAVGAANVSAFSTADVIVITTVQKTNTAADKKTKTLVTNATVDFTSNVAAQAAVLSLSKADIYRIVSVSMSTNTSFGGAYSATGAIDITNRYTLDNGQRATYYGVGTLTLKPGQSKPTGPVRVTFDYFTHGTGDYFSVDSYSGIAYKDIPSFTHGNKVYQLRDCLDFRPRINDAGTGFSGAGATVNDFLDPTSDVTTDYSYYLPRTDKIVVDNDGIFNIIEGTSSLIPVEPKTPEDSMALFVLKQKAYVFDIDADVEIVNIDNRRYTMRDIGRIENRVKNLEYYTSLNLLERETESLQVQDVNGFDRFKNGFIVDNFSGHNVGDVTNRDYKVAIDYNKKELRPFSITRGAKLEEINSSTAARTANNYSKVTSLVTLPFTEVEYVKNSKASTTENINPFSVITWRGQITLDPPGDMWYQEASLPAIRQNDEGLWDQFLSDAVNNGYGATWGNWRTLNFGDTRTELRVGQQYNVIESIDSSTSNDVVRNRYIVPKMRNVAIKFTGEGLKPNTRIQIFFDGFKVTDQCSLANTAANANTGVLFTEQTAVSNSNNLITDNTGKIEGIFYYNSNTLGLSAGNKSFRITDSPNNSNNFETIAETIFVADGQFTFPETRPRPTNVNEIVRNDDGNTNTGGGTVNGIVYLQDVWDVTMKYGIGSSTASTNKGEAADNLKSALDNYTASGGDSTIISSSVNYDGDGGVGVTPALFATAAATASDDAKALWAEVRASLAAESSSSSSGLVAGHQNNGADLNTALDFAAYQITVGLMAEKTTPGTIDSYGWANDVTDAVNNPINKV